MVTFFSLFLIVIFFILIFIDFSFLCNKQNCQKQFFFFLKRKCINKEKRIHTDISHFFIIFKLLFFYKNPFLLPRNQIKNSRAKLNLDIYLTATRKTYFEFGPKLMLKDWRLDVRFWIYAEYKSALRLEDQTCSYPFIFQLLEIKMSGFGSMLLLSGAFLFWTR